MASEVPRSITILLLILQPFAKCADLLSPQDVRHSVRAQCEGLGGAFARVFVGGDCFYRDASADQSWSDSWEHCGAAVAGGGLAHFYTEPLLRVALVEGVITSTWARIGASHPNLTHITHLTLNGTGSHYWRFAKGGPDARTDFPVQYFDAARSMPVAPTAQTCTFAKHTPAADAFTFGADRCDGSTVHNVACHRRSPAKSYKLVVKNQLPMHQSRHEETVEDGDVRRCAHACLVRKWCFAFAHNTRTGNCAVYEQLAEDMRTVPTQGADDYNYYALNLVEDLRILCYKHIGKDASATGVAFYRHRCYATFANTNTYAAAMRMCAQRGEAHGIKGGRLAYIRSKRMLEALAATLSAASQCPFIVGYQANSTQAGEPYGNWVYADWTTGALVDFHLPPSAWGAGQPNNGIQYGASHLRACFFAGGASELRDNPNRRSINVPNNDRALCEYAEPDHRSEWRPVAADVHWEDAHVLRTVHNVASSDACGFLCSGRIDCAAIAYNQDTKVCELQRFEFNEPAFERTSRLPVAGEKIAASGFTFYDEY